MICKVCDKEFESLRGLHGHLKMHEGLHKYYHEYSPRRDKFDGSLINFKNYSQYFSTCFESQMTRRKFYDERSPEEVRAAIKEEWAINLKTKDLAALPSETFFMLTDFCRVQDIRRSFGSTKQFCEELKIEQLYNKQLPSGFWKTKTDDMLVLVDTREQQPFLFKNSEVQKLSIGDYMTAGDRFSKVSVDRKASSDFQGSFGKQIDRIRDNIQLAKDMGYRMCFVVEAFPHEMEEEAQKKKLRTSFGYIFRNAREVLADFPETQILFCASKKQAQDITEKILWYGDELKGVDLQFFINQHVG